MTTVIGIQKGKTVFKTNFSYEDEKNEKAVVTDFINEMQSKGFECHVEYTVKKIEKEFFIGELNICFDDKEVTTFVLIDSDSIENAKKKLHEYVYHYYDNVESSEEGEYIFEGGNCIIYAQLAFDFTLTIKKYIELLGGRIII